MSPEAPDGLGYRERRGVGRREGTRDRRARAPDLAPRQGVLLRARRDQARSRQPLPPLRRAADAHDGGPADADATLPRRGERVELLPEARPEVGARLAADDGREHTEWHDVASPR